MVSKHLGWRKVGIIMALVALLMLGLAPASLALDGREGDNVVIGPDEVIDDDLYVGATTFTLDGTVKGDLIVAGSEITINGTVEGSVWAAGRTVTVNGTVKNSARIAGAALIVGENAKITRDLIAAGYSLETKAGSSIGSDLYYGGAQALAAGTVARDVKAGCNGFELRGSIGRNAEIFLSESANVGQYPQAAGFMPYLPPVPTVPYQLTLAPGAKIGGNLDYTSWTSVSTEGIVAGQATRHDPPVNQTQRRVQPVEAGRAGAFSAGMAVLIWIWNQARRLITLFLVGMLLAFVFPAWTKKLMDKVQGQPLPSLGWGFVTMVAVFFGFWIIVFVTVLLALLLGVITLGGLMGTVVALGVLAALVLVIAFGLAAGYVSQVVISYLIGRLIFAKAHLDQTLERILALVVGLILYVLVTAIPCVGSIIGFVAALFGLGAIWLWAREALSKKAPAA